MELIYRFMLKDCLMALTVHNTFSGRKEPFVPADPSRVTMYVCGPTVYSYSHIGNARPAVVFDLFFRMLRAEYGPENVIYARNFTDIDDKMIQAAQTAGVTVKEIADKYKAAYLDDMGALGVLRPSIEPLATEHMPEMIAMTTRLIERGHAYVAQNHVLFDVSSYGAYGGLSKVDTEDMLAGARVEVAPYKRNAADFVLWKPSKQGEPSWEMPASWGDMQPARPGWHLECSAMIEKSLLQDALSAIDIHGGGQDLRFPHHENEIAQSCCAHPNIDPSENHVPLAKYWMHNAFLQMGKDKMSKSIGNIVTPHELLESWDGEVLRFALLSAQYRQPLEWTEALLEQSKRQLERFYRVLIELSDVEADISIEVPAEIMEPLSDDLNSPEAIAGLHALREQASKATGAARVAAKSRLLRAGAMLGLLQQDPEAFIKGRASEGDLADSDIDALLVERAEARAAKNFTRSDEIRDQLTAAGIIIEDSKDGATWRRG